MRLRNSPTYGFSIVQQSKTNLTHDEIAQCVNNSSKRKEHLKTKTSGFHCRWKFTLISPKFVNCLQNSKMNSTQDDPNL